MRFSYNLKFLTRHLCRGSLAILYLPVAHFCAVNPLPLRDGLVLADTHIMNSQSSVECKEASMVAWARKRGIHLRKPLCLKRSQGKGIGVFLKSAVNEGDLLLSIPPSQILCAENIELDPAIGHLVGPLRMAGLDDRGVLVLWLVHHLTQPTSHGWTPYLSMLPSEYDLSADHLLLSNETISGTPLAAAVAEMKKNISRQANSVLKAIKLLDPPEPLKDLSSLELSRVWSYAHVLVLTRSSVLSKINPQSDWTEQPVCILPLVDFCNHSEDPNAKVVLETDGSVNLVALRSISLNEEVLISYWPDKEPINCEQSLFSYGFLSNKDRFAFPGIALENSNQEPRKVIQKLILMDTRSGKTVNDTVFLDEIESILDYFAIECMQENDINSLVKNYVAERGIGAHSRAILEKGRRLARKKVLDILTEWRDQVRYNHSRSAVISEYLKRLDEAVNQALAIIVP